MKILKIVFLWPLFFFASISLDTQAQELGPIEFCHTIAQSKKQELKFFKRVELLKEALLMRYFPSAFAHPEIKEINTVERLGQSLPTSNAIGKNVIFALGPDPMELELFKQDHKLQARLDQIELEIAASSKVLSKMFRANTLEKCSRIARQNNFSHQEFIKLVNERAQIPWNRQVKELAKLDKQVKRLLKNSKLSWEYRQSTRIEDVLTALAGGHYENILVIGHGQSNGQLIDSSHSTYPIGSFTQIAPQVKSLAFYSCYGSKTLEHYSLEKHLRERASIHPKRFVVSVKERKQELAGQVAPLEGFKKFFKTWDKRLSNMSKTIFRPSSEGSPKCALEVEDFSLEKGVLSVSLNRNLVGIIRPSSQRHLATFDCELLNPEKNVVVIKNEDTNQLATGLFSTLRLQMVDENQNTFSSNTQLFLNADQSLRSILIRF